MIELNISCPNVKEGGMALEFAVIPHGDRRVPAAAAQKLMVKLSPNAENIVEMAYTCAEEGADAISLVNTFNAWLSMRKKRRPIFDNVTAGLSVPPSPIALRMVRWQRL